MLSPLSDLNYPCPALDALISRTLVFRQGSYLYVIPDARSEAFEIIGLAARANVYGLCVLHLFVGRYPYLIARSTRFLLPADFHRALAGLGFGLDALEVAAACFRPDRIPNIASVYGYFV